MAGRGEIVNVLVNWFNMIPTSGHASQNRSRGEGEESTFDVCII